MAGGWGKSTPATSPECWGRSWASRPSCCAVAARALTPIHSDSAPPSPCAGLWRVFRVKGGSRGWCGPQPRRGEDTAPDATGATQACRQGVGGALPPAPLPLGERPPAGPPEALVRRAVQGAPPPGFQGARSPLGLAQRTKNPLPKAGIFCSSSFALRLFTAPRRGPKSQRQKGEPRKATDNGALGFSM